MNGSRKRRRRASFSNLEFSGPAGSVIPNLNDGRVGLACVRRASHMEVLRSEVLYFGFEVEDAENQIVIKFVKFLIWFAGLPSARFFQSFDDELHSFVKIAELLGLGLLIGGFGCEVFLLVVHSRCYQTVNFS